MKQTAIAIAMLTMIGLPCQAQELAFRAALRGDRPPSDTGSAALGDAGLRVNVATQTVDLTLDVRGIALDQLSTPLKTAPVGPIHLHFYGTHNHADPDAPVELVFAAPFGSTYQPTSQGFRLEVKGRSYAQSASAVKSTLAFGDFVKALQGGAVVVNIHTNAWPQGEISGPVVPSSI